MFSEPPVNHMDSTDLNKEDPSLESLAAVMREVAQAEILPAFGLVQARAKADGSLLTEVDLAVQQRLIKALERLTPGIAVLGEEMPESEQLRLLERASADDAHAGEASAFWALDPLDGTSNFACGFPAFAISLALFRKGQAELGIIYDPVRDECFSARLGQGAWLNGDPLQCRRDCQRLADAMALIDFKRIPPERVPGLIRTGAFRSQRNLGSVALDWCWLASGRAQIYLHGAQRLWDYAAGRLIAAEAGVITRMLPPGLAEPSAGLTLAPRLAMAAAHPALFDQWWEHVGLPWRE
ncbi:inositol monophosphatase family protein [Thiorhodovibrio frisius]|uniref:Inositol monophosphatase/fructose-1,6-bisphosphatase family protein n=1 Tax=Thiorhodovibrio frisius TaxID=631362 RepID=H8Z578_9GAMM|nr:inositol monophosphatase family protein [Thiorhodovibrio frisius]EIC20485.1 inositol monophosphatase/fructose-1,6-bisphosphatase family protein [Thiorhodovibrio frisius]WPL21226.1 Inositol-1-monophosphatase [Thiorhodovibrio frisius]